MNKTQFIKSIAETSGLTIKEATAAYDAFVETVVKSLKNGEKVSLLGFGNFELKKRAARMGINPQTKEQVKISASNAPAFKVSKTFKSLFN
ncbi:MAG: HU family DNA-binding protein [Clostridia bacterium]|nr:HU family DNA-binding protein [Clostridia bacterium]MDD4685803.1 HU family DNA-binding protein [Clostridia bacterium]